MASTIPSLVFCLILLLHLGSSHTYTTYRTGSSHFVIRSSGYSRAPSTTPACPSAPSGGSNKLPLIHRLSPCSPHHDGRNNNEQPEDVFRRDSHRLRSLLKSHSGVGAAAAAPAPAPSSSGLTVPAVGTPSSDAAGILEYSILAGYGTPVQQLHVTFDVNIGISLLRCKPCPAGAPCDPAFDPSRSSSLAQVGCGSSECPTECSGLTTCPFVLHNGNSSTALCNGTVVKDTLTLSPSATFTGFRFGCMKDGGDLFDTAAGVIDMSRDKFSLVSRITASPGSDTAAAFSYCLPASTTSSHGFLSIGDTRPEYSGVGVTYTPMIQNPSFYVVELVGINVGGLRLPVPPTAPDANATVLEVAASFTFLRPAIYAALRHEFQNEMSQYPKAPPFGALDTCYNFTGLHVIVYPAIVLEFGGGASLDPDVLQFMYFPDSDLFSVGCLAFAPSPDDIPFSVVGSMVQHGTEVVYDVQGGKVGFVPRSC